MRKSLFLLALAAVLFTTACSTRVPDTVNNIPDHAFMVLSMHPKKMYDKGDVGNMQHLINKFQKPVIRKVLKDPLSSGIELNDYAFVFIYFIDDEPMIGATMSINDPAKFSDVIAGLNEDENLDIIDHKGHSMIVDDDDAALAWDDKELVFLSSPGKDLSRTQWQEELTRLFDLTKEESITSIVDFNSFSRNMKDFNVWFTGDEMKRILEKMQVNGNMDIDLPLSLMNNYGRLFVEFEQGEMRVHSETHFSDDVTKAAETFMVARSELNEDLLKLAPGNDLLMALAFSIDIDKMVKLMKQFSPPEMDTVSNKVEQMTGIPGNEILESLNGDFVLAVNSAQEGGLLPVEIMIGIGLDDKKLQEHLMGRVNQMADVEQEGDFFMIQANGMELYSGILNDIWVITNTPGYKDKVTGKGLDITLEDSPFSDFDDGAMGMYLKMDLSEYPSMVKGLVDQQDLPEMVDEATGAFSYMGIEGSNQSNDMLLVMQNKQDNSLQTLMQLLDKAIAEKE